MPCVSRFVALCPIYRKGQTVSIYSNMTETGDLEEIVSKAVDRLSTMSDKFDIIAVTGISGLMVGSPVSLALRKKLVVIRKNGENAHTSRHPGLSDPDTIGHRWIFLDDFVSSGESRRRVRDAINRTHLTWSYIGTYSYENDIDAKLTQEDRNDYKRYGIESDFTGWDGADK